MLHRPSVHPIAERALRPIESPSGNLNRQPLIHLRRETPLRKRTNPLTIRNESINPLHAKNSRCPRLQRLRDSVNVAPPAVAHFAEEAISRLFRLPTG